MPSPVPPEHLRYLKDIGLGQPTPRLKPGPPSISTNRGAPNVAVQPAAASASPVHTTPTPVSPGSTWIQWLNGCWHNLGSLATYFFGGISIVFLYDFLTRFLRFWGVLGLTLATLVTFEGTLQAQSFHEFPAVGPGQPASFPVPKDPAPQTYVPSGPPTNPMFLELSSDVSVAKPTTPSPDATRTVRSATPESKSAKTERRANDALPLLLSLSILTNVVIAGLQLWMLFANERHGPRKRRSIIRPPRSIAQPQRIEYERSSEVERDRVKHARPIPTALCAQTATSPAPWRSYAASVPGGVRKENEDAVQCFSVRDTFFEWEVLVVADGCGGTPGGRLASQTTVQAARRAIESELSLGTHAETVVELAFEAASVALSNLGQYHDEFSAGPIAGDGTHATPVHGLRTTLIVALISDTTVIGGFIGDGAFLLATPTGRCRDLIIPHRPADGRQNVLTASLGPQIKGSPEFFSLPRHSGEWVIVATDGIADRVVCMAETSRQLIETIESNNGNVKATVDQFLAQCSAQGFDFDDNLTLGIVPYRPLDHEPAKSRQIYK